MKTSCFFTFLVRTARNSYRRTCPFDTDGIRSRDLWRGLDFCDLFYRISSHRDLVQFRQSFPLGLSLFSFSRDTQFISSSLLRSVTELAFLRSIMAVAFYRFRLCFIRSSMNCMSQFHNEFNLFCWSTPISSHPSRQWLFGNEGFGPLLPHFSRELPFPFCFWFSGYPWRARARAGARCVLVLKKREFIPRHAVTKTVSRFFSFNHRTALRAAPCRSFGW